MRIDQFEIERMQAIHWHQVQYDLSESGVQPLTITELLADDADIEHTLAGLARVDEVFSALVHSR